VRRGDKDAVVGTDEVLTTGFDNERAAFGSYTGVNYDTVDSSAGEVRGDVAEDESRGAYVLRRHAMEDVDNRDVM
jgi:hypothetical protein